MRQTLKEAGALLVTVVVCITIVTAGVLVLGPAVRDLLLLVFRGQ